MPQLVVRFAFAPVASSLLPSLATALLIQVV